MQSTCGAPLDAHLGEETDSMAGTLIILRGESLTGKTAAARRLARSFRKGAHVEIDRLLGFFPEDRPNPSQIQVALLSAAACADNLLAAGFDTIVEWLFWEPELLDFFLGALRNRNCEIHLLTLCASSEIRRARRSLMVAAPDRSSKSDTSVRLIGDRDRRGARIDTSSLTLDAVCSAIAEIVDGRRSLLEPLLIARGKP